MSLGPSLSSSEPIFLVGATGAGKSELALALARRLGGAILALDAMQVYRGADIGTSKPTAAERAEIPHGGLDLVDFGGRFDVAHYLAHAAEFLREQRDAARPVIIVGGTGLYFRALTRGLCEAPQGTEDLRAELNLLSTEALRERLRQVDAVMLERIDASNPRRLIRALEVIETTGRSLRAWQEETPAPLIPQYRAFWLQREKGELQKRIARRVETMFAAGWETEVRGLIERYGWEAVRAFSGIGYREIGGLVGNQDQISKLTKLTEWGEREEGEEEQEEQGIKRGKVKMAIEVATRQYAKRQLTWFQREPTLKAVMLAGPQSLPEAILSLI